jgi:hypothetical protein
VLKSIYSINDSILVTSWLLFWNISK